MLTSLRAFLPLYMVPCKVSHLVQRLSADGSVLQSGPPGLLFITRHHLGGGGGPTHPPTHPPTSPARPLKRLGQNFLPGLRPIKTFLWRLRRQLVNQKSPRFSSAPSASLKSHHHFGRGGGGGAGGWKCGNDTSKSSGRSGRQNAATRRNMRREERVTVQGPVKEQQSDGMSHRGGGGGAHAHGNAVRQVVDDRRAEVRGKRKPSNDPRSNQHSPGTPTTGLRERGNNTSRTTVRSSRQNAATRRSMRREERVTVQGPVKNTQGGGHLVQAGHATAFVLLCTGRDVVHSGRLLQCPVCRVDRVCACVPGLDRGWGWGWAWARAGA